jgi:hypothetical protein
VSDSRLSLPAAAVPAAVPSARSASSLVAADPDGLSAAAIFAAVTLAAVGTRWSVSRASSSNTTALTARPLIVTTRWDASRSPPAKTWAPRGLTGIRTPC